MSFAYNPIKYFLKLGSFKLESEAVFAFIAFAFFIWWVVKEIKKEKMKMGGFSLFWFLFAVIFGSLAGGRLWHYAFNWKGLGTFADIFNLMKPGLASFGMILGGILTVFIYIYFYNKKNKENKDWRVVFAKYADIIAPAAALFIFIYRMGCFHYGDVLGTPTNLPWGVVMAKGKYAGIVMHPTPLYLSLSALLIFIFLHWYKNRRKFDGEIALLFLLIYSFNRFWIEFLRLGEKLYFGLNEGQIVLMIIFVIVSIYLTLEYSLYSKLNCTSYKDYYMKGKKQKIKSAFHYFFLRK
jgi:prolipoprotein diacylglyceryl transferase